MEDYLEFVKCANCSHKDECNIGSFADENSKEVQCEDYDE